MKKTLTLSSIILCICIIISGCKKSEPVIDLCAGITCMYNGTCVTGTCNCPYYAEGKTCDTLVRQKFIATYVGTATNSYQVGTTPATVYVTEGPDSLSEITMSIVGNQLSDSVHATTYRSGTIITPSQPAGPGTISGTGLLSGAALYDTLIISTGLGNVSIYFSGVKQ